VTARRLAELMVGSELPTPETRESTVTNDVAFAVDSLVVADSDGRIVLDDVSFSIRRGEIVGVAGVEGNGQTELIRALIGVLPIKSGTIAMEGHDITRLHTRDRRALGIGYVPEDRHHDGLVLTAPLWSNVVLGHQDQEPFAHGLFLDRDAARERTRQIITEYDVKAPSPDTAALALSGGNQQKLIIGREMTVDPKVLIAAHPTRGIDVGAQAAVWEEVKRARAAGLATLLISADLEELIGLSDTLLVMLRGKIVATLDPAKVTAPELGSWMTGAHEGQGAA
jgi:simple sugar transport system ATP-binding protein